MTHDELLDAVNWSVELAQEQYLQELLNQMKALRAVVELHKPWPGGCSQCINIEGGYVSYPCLTIQVIEKDLNG